MDTLTNGLSQGDFTLLRVLDPATGQMTNVLALIGAAGGGAVTSATAPLSINSGVLSINLVGYIPTSHEAYNVGQANVNFGAYDARTRTLTLENASGGDLSVERGPRGQPERGDRGGGDDACAHRLGAHAP